MKVILSLFVLSVFLLSFTQAQLRSACCCGGGWILAAPPNIQMECLFQHDYFSFQQNPEYTGFAARLDSCAFSECSFTSCPLYCDDDDEDGFVRVSFTDEYNLVPNQISETPICGNARTIRKTWTSDCGGARTTFQDVTIRDTIPPEVFAPADQIQECISTNGLAGPDVLIDDFDEYFGSARATDLCTNPLWTTYSAVQSSPDPCDTRYTRIFTANDGCQPTTANQFVRFVDTTPPVIEVDAMIRLTCESPLINTPPVPTQRDACDNLGPAPTILSSTLYPGKCGGDYTIERIWTATDACGNTAFATQIIIVEDHDAPVIDPPPVDTIDYITCLTVPPLIDYTATDFCGSAAISMEETISGMTEHSERYDIIRTYKASDDCGNSVSWKKVYVVNLASATQLTLNTPTTNPYSVNRGVAITLDFNIDGYVCNTAYFVLDIGAATLVSISQVDCTAQNGGAIYCPIPPFSSPPTINFNAVINVPLTYQPDTLQVRYSIAQTDPTFDSNLSDNFLIIKLTGP